MTTRPEIGARVRYVGRSAFFGARIGTSVGTVTAHHEDGIAFRVEFDNGERIICDPVAVELAKAMGDPIDATREKVTGVST